MKKKLLILSATLFISLGAFTQSGDKGQTPGSAIRQYWFVLLTKGSNRDQDSTTAARLQEGHLANIKKLYSEGKIKVAGPFGEEGDWKGIFIFDCPTKEEVEKLLKTDPAIAAGRLIYQIKSWYTMPTGSFVPGRPKEDLF